MLQIAESLKNLRFDALSRLYDLNWRQEAEFYDYLHHDFFQTPGAAYCLWEDGGVYISAVRVEPYRDGMILAGLETDTTFRGRGFAVALVKAVLQWGNQQGISKFYSHIHHRNAASIRVHQQCGLEKISDCAVFLDGSASAAYDTYLYDSEKATH